MPLSELLAPSAATRTRARSTPRWTTRPAKIEEVAASARRRPAGPARRADGRVRRLVVQRAAVQHRAAAAAERGGPDPGAARGEDRRASSRSIRGRGRRPHVTACDRRAARDPGVPERPRRVDYLEDEQVIVCRTCGLPLPGPRRHPGDADRRGREARDGPRAIESGRRSSTIEALALDPGGDARPVAALGRAASHARVRDRARGRPACPRSTASRRWSFCGMGGSAVAGDVLRRRFRDRLWRCRST